MIGFFLLSLPVFGVIGVGWAATRAHLLTSGALDALNVFSFRFALPALVLRLIAAQPLRQTFNPRFYAGYLASGVIVFVLVLLTLEDDTRQALIVTPLWFIALGLGWLFIGKKRMAGMR